MSVCALLNSYCSNSQFFPRWTGFAVSFTVSLGGLRDGGGRKC